MLNGDGRWNWGRECERVCGWLVYEWVCDEWDESGLRGKEFVWGGGIVEDRGRGRGVGDFVGGGFWGSDGGE